MPPAIAVPEVEVGARLGDRYRLIARLGARSLKTNAQVRAELNGVVVGSGAGTGASVATALR